jgi:hypothetical protein
VTPAGSTCSPAEAPHERGANVVRVPPPLCFGAAFAAAIVLRQTTTPLSIGWAATRLVGGVAFAAGAALCPSAVATGERHRTTIVPHHPVPTLLTGGAYRISRNRCTPD